MAYLIDSHTVYPHANARRHSQGCLASTTPTPPSVITSRREDVAFAHERSHSRAHERKRLRHRADVVPKVVRARPRVV